MAAHDAKTCSRCGGPLELRHLNGMEVEVCVRCGAAVLDRADLEELTANAILSAPQAPATDTGVPKTPPPREKHDPWDYTPPPAPPRDAAALQKTIIPTLPVESEDTTEEAPLVVGARIHDSVPPVKPRESSPDSELPTGPPTPAPVKEVPPPLRAEPALGRIAERPPPPPPPPSLRKTVRPQDADDPVRPGRPITLPDEPELGTALAVEHVDEPALDLGLPEESTEEAPLDKTDKDVSRWQSDSDDVLQAWRARRRRNRILISAALVATTLVALAAILGVVAWEEVLGPRWRASHADLGGPDLSQVVGEEPSGQIIAEQPGTRSAPANPATAASTSTVPASAPAPAAAPAPAPAAAPAPAPAAAPAPAPAAAPAPAPAAAHAKAPAPEVHAAAHAKAPAPEVAAARHAKAPAPVPMPVPTSHAAPAPAPRAAPTGRKALIDRGWAVVDSDPDAALALFGQVLKDTPGDYEGNYGYGYALLQKNEPDKAKDYLCHALPSPDVTIRREVTGLLSQHDLSCE